MPTYPDFTAVPMVYGSKAAAALIAAALAGTIAMELWIEGDSNDDQYAGNGGYSIPQRNAAVLPYQRANGYYLRSSGWTRGALTGPTVWTHRAPISHRTINSGVSGTNGSTYLLGEAAYTGLSAAAKTALAKALLPADIEASSLAPWVCPKYEAGTGSIGLTAILQAYGDQFPPELSGCVGPGAQWWQIDETGTYLDVEFLCCNAAGYVDEAKIVINGTSTIFPEAGVPASSRQIITTGAGGYSALQLAQTPLMSSDDANGLPTVKRVRFGPLTWKDSGGTVRNNIQVHFTGDGGKVVVKRYRFIRPSDKGLSFEPNAVITGNTATNAVSSYTSASEWAALYAQDPTVRKGLLITVGVNDRYNLSKTPDEWIADVAALIADRRTKTGDASMPAYISIFPYRDNSATSGSADSLDALFDQFAGAATAKIDDGTLTNTGLLNTRRWTDAVGWNRTNENIFSVKAASTGMLARDGYAPWTSGATYAAQLVAAGAAPYPILAGSSTVAANSNHPVYGGNARYAWAGARRLHLSSNQSGGTCTPDNPHPSAFGMGVLRHAEMTLLERFAATANGNSPLRGRNG